MHKEHLKQEVYNYWNKASCGTEFVKKEKFSKEYFEEIEQIRYLVEPEIFAFAQFTRFYGKKVLEVGVGAGNMPTYDPNHRESFHGGNLRNQALTDTFEPGSIMKPFTVALALELKRMALI